MKNETLLTHFGKGLIQNNPVFVQVLGMCPTLAVTTSAVNGLAMGAATTFVLFFSAAIATLVNVIVPSQVRIPVYAVIIATFVTIADLILKAFFPPLSAALGPYVPLIVVNCMILGRIEAFATRNPFLPSLADALGMGAGFTAALMILGAVRELLGAGEIFGAVILGSAYPPMLIMILPPGAFLVLGILMALFNHLQEKDLPILRKAG
ncbi:MAG: electron transport complex subunit E [Spirochaetaceae bacterium]|nr:electron transport complex subunit E [Spirochaetaceae bacterium]MCF7947411.1 electron transport complex subunit E [Spirochaetia bacterium]MCF7951324.1 electron transport complex subunit E [Spirochaetaceae bacterium]